MRPIRARFREAVFARLRAGSRDERAGAQVLGYHDVPDAALFETHIKRLVDAGTMFASLNAVVTGEASQGVAITFDDGYESQFVNALPVLRRLKIPATVFVVAGRIGGRADWPAAPGASAPPPPLPLMNRTHILEARDWGFEIGAHGWTHALLTHASEISVQQEVITARESLAMLIDGPVRSLAYPYGAFDDRTIAVAAEAGYSTAVTTIPGAVTADTNRLAVPRSFPYVGAGTEELMYCRTGRAYPPLAGNPVATIGRRLFGSLVARDE